jgi:ABC-type uncharacterized transport system ATPase subunit
MIQSNLSKISLLSILIHKYSPLSFPIVIPEEPFSGLDSTFSTFGVDGASKSIEGIGVCVVEILC